MSNSVRKFINTHTWSASTRMYTLLGALLLIIVIPFSVYYANQQKANNLSQAAASTTLAFSQPTLQVNPGSPVSLDITMNPGSNAVSLITLVIDYDSSMVTPNPTTGITPNTTAFPSTLDGPTYGTCNGTQCTMTISLSVGNDPTKAIIQTTTIATVNFQSVAQGTTQLAFDQKTQVFSVAAGDQANENVLSTTTPSTITIGQGSGISPTSFPQATTTPTQSQNQPTLTSSPNTSVTPNPTGPQPTGGPVVCKQQDNDTDNDVNKAITTARQHIANIESQMNNLVQHNELSKTQKLAFAQTATQNLATTDTALQKSAKALNIDSSTTGGCVGNFNPNNPNFVNDCNHPNAVGSTPLETLWQNVVNQVQSLFGGHPPTQ